jgi:hypothetical protein
MTYRKSAYLLKKEQEMLGIIQNNMNLLAKAQFRSETTWLGEDTILCLRMSWIDLQGKKHVAEIFIDDDERTPSDFFIDHKEKIIGREQILNKIQEMLAELEKS